MPTFLQDLSHAIRGLRHDRAFWWRRSSRWPSASAPTSPSSAWSTRCCCDRCPFGDRSDRVVTLHSTHRCSPKIGTTPICRTRTSPTSAASRTSFDGIAGFVPQLHRDDRSRCRSPAGRFGDARDVSDARCRTDARPDFTADEAAAPGLESVVILTHGLWQRRFGGDPAIIGRGVIINERARTVVGVMPPGFKFPERSELFMPLAAGRVAARLRETSVSLQCSKRGASIDAGTESTSTAIARRLESTYPATNRGFGIRVLSFRDSQVGRDDRADQQAR